MPTELTPTKLFPSWGDPTTQIKGMRSILNHCQRCTVNVYLNICLLQELSIKPWNILINNLPVQCGGKRGCSSKAYNKKWRVLWAKTGLSFFCLILKRTRNKRTKTPPPKASRRSINLLRSPNKNPARNNRKNSLNSKSSDFQISLAFSYWYFKSSEGKYLAGV